jgi:hypothetical protein
VFTFANHGDRDRVRGTSAGYGFDAINANMLLGQDAPGSETCRSESYRGCVNHKKISGFTTHRQQRGGVLQ